MNDTTHAIGILAGLILLTGALVGTVHAGPDCTPQPVDESGNGCADAAVINLDANGGTYTWTGDNSDATNGMCEFSGQPCRLSAAEGEDCEVDESCVLAGECNGFGNDPLEWIAFAIGEPSVCQIDYCCTDPDSRVADVRYIVVTDNCSPDSSECGEFTFRDGPCDTCTDDNPCNEFTPDAGTWYYPLNADRYCDGTTTTCATDDDCGGTPDACYDSAGPYQLHVSCTPQEFVPCCFNQSCSELTLTECLAFGGQPLDPELSCLPDNPCITGACCLLNGLCVDGGGIGIPPGECVGLFVPGATCNEPDTCPVCTIDDPANCQDSNGDFIVRNDRALWEQNDISRWVDDFQVENTGPLTRICYQPAFFNPDARTECSAPGQTPPDNFQMRIYENDNGLPGAEIGTSQTLAVVIKNSNGGASRVWTYSFDIPTPPMLAAGECYWLEVTGEGQGQGGCTVYATMSADGNSYVLNDEDGTFGTEDVVTEIGFPPNTAVDLAFCVENGMADAGCGEFLGACCTPPFGTPCTSRTNSECDALDGVWFGGTTCIPEQCAGGCEANDCNAAVNLNDEFESLPFMRSYDTSLCVNESASSACDIQQGDTGQTGTTSIGNAAWFKYTTGPHECGILEISACQGSYDGALAVWIDECPTTKDMPIACGDDTCGEPAGMPDTNLIVQGGETVIVKAGGWNGSTGTGTLQWSWIKKGDVCDHLSPPLADNRYDIDENIQFCTSDDGCDGMAVCVEGRCYVPTNRMLGIKPAQSASLTYRVSLRTATAGNVVLGFTGAETVEFTPGPGPNNYLVARVVDVAEASYRNWVEAADADGGGFLMINDCEIAPGRSYAIQALSEGNDPTNEANYSDDLVLPTSKYGDSTGGGAIGTPPDGAANLIDVFACIQAYQVLQAAPKHWYELDPAGDANFPVINLADTFRFILAFQGDAYSPDPLDCP